MPSSLYLEKALVLVPSTMLRSGASRPARVRLNRACIGQCASHLGGGGGAHPAAVNKARRGMSFSIFCANGRALSSIVAFFSHLFKIPDLHEADESMPALPAAADSEGAARCLPAPAAASAPAPSAAADPPHPSAEQLQESRALPELLYAGLQAAEARRGPRT